MANSTTQTQTEREQVNTRIFTQDTGDSELSAPGGHEPGVSTNDALMSPFPSIAPAQQVDNTTGRNPSPRPRYYSQGQNSMTAPQTGVVQTNDQINSSQTNQSPAFNSEERGGPPHNQLSNASAPPDAILHGQNNTGTNEIANYHEFQGTKPASSQLVPPVQVQTAGDRSNTTKPASTQLVPPAQPLTARDRFNTVKPDPSQQWKNPQNVGPNGMPRPVNNMVIPLDGLRDSQGQVDCPRCHQQVVTRVVKVTGTTATTWSVILCLLTGICCAWIPCVIDDCKDAEHYCFNCGLLLATYTAGGHSRVHAMVKPPRAPGQNADHTGYQSGTATKEMPRDIPGQQYNQQQQMQYTSQFGGPHQADGRPLGQDSYVSPPIEVQGTPVGHQDSDQTTGVTTGTIDTANSGDKRLEQSLEENKVHNNAGQSNSGQ